MSTTNSAGHDAGTSMHPAIGDEDPPERDDEADDEPEFRECWTCRGTGLGQYDGVHCTACNGSGDADALERIQNYKDEKAEHDAEQRRDDGYRY